MKHITIYQEGAEPILVNDDNNQDLISYTKELSSILENNNISILQNKFTSVIIRPSKIISIAVKEQVIEEKLIKEKPKDIIQTKKHSKKKESVEKDEYTLTDEE